MKLKLGCRLWWIVLPIILADRLTKVLALKYLAPNGVKTAIGSLLSWAYVENRGMAFGMADGKGVALIVLTAAVMAGLLAYILTHPDEGKLLRGGLWMLLGGGLGNLYDRIFYGFVVDFIRLDFLDFPVFNVADIFVCMGVGLALLAVLIEEWRKKHG